MFLINCSFYSNQKVRLKFSTMCTNSQSWTWKRKKTTILFSVFCNVTMMNFLSLVKVVILWSLSLINQLRRRKCLIHKRKDDVLLCGRLKNIAIDSHPDPVSQTNSLPKVVHTDPPLIANLPPASPSPHAIPPDMSVSVFLTVSTRSFPEICTFAFADIICYWYLYKIETKI